MLKQEQRKHLWSVKCWHDCLQMPTVSKNSCIRQLHPDMFSLVWSWKCRFRCNQIIKWGKIAATICSKMHIEKVTAVPRTMAGCLGYSIEKSRLWMSSLCDRVYVYITVLCNVWYIKVLTVTQESQDKVCQTAGFSCNCRTEYEW